MRMLELFSGSGVMSEAFRAEGFDTITIDSEPEFKPDYALDIFNFEAIPLSFDVIWASPPCTTFSVASIRHYWKDGKPANERTERGIAIVKRTLEIIQAIRPRFWFIENPRGMLRKQDFMQSLPRKTVTYCQYGHQAMKPTDIWTNADIPFKPMCKNGDPCHVRASRGAKAGVQGIYNADYFDKHRSAYYRAVLPDALCKFVAHWCKDQLAPSGTRFSRSENMPHSPEGRIAEQEK